MASHQLAAVVAAMYGPPDKHPPSARKHELVPPAVRLVAPDVPSALDLALFGGLVAVAHLHSIRGSGAAVRTGLWCKQHIGGK